MSTLGEDSPQRWFHRLATHYVEAQILYHLGSLGVFNKLYDGAPYSAAAIASDLDLDAGLLDTLLNYITQVDEILCREPEGRYYLTEFGKTVLNRFSRHTGQEREVNLFNVRVGCYGPVWSGLDQLLRKQARYGHEIKRQGGIASNAVHTLSTRLAPALLESISLVDARAVIELGVSTALLEEAAQAQPSLALAGIDRSMAALEEAAQRMAPASAARTQWLQGDVFEPRGWTLDEETADGCLFFSVHMHEFLASGLPRLQQALRQMRERFPGCHLLALEQPRLDTSAREQTEESLWLYAQSNVLIHHVIGNGKILADDAWCDAFEGAGCLVKYNRPIGYLGYRAYLLRL